LIKLPSNFMGLIGAPWSGHVAARHGARRAALIASGLILAGWLAMTAWHGSPWLLVAWAIIAALGGAMMLAAVPNLVVEVAPPERTSELVGLTQVFRTIGSAIGNQGASLLLAVWTVKDLSRGPTAFPASDAYVLTFGAIAACAGAGLLVAFALPLAERRATAPEPAGDSQRHTQ
jgi:MFS family permease